MPPDAHNKPPEVNYQHNAPSKPVGGPVAKPPQAEPDEATQPNNQPSAQSSKAPSGRAQGYQKMIDQGEQPDAEKMFGDMKRTLNDAINKKPGQGHDTDPYSMFTFRSPHMREQHNMFVRDYLTNMNEHLDYLKRQLDKYKSSPMLYKQEMSKILSWWQTKMNNIRQLGVMTNILHQTDPSKPPSTDSKGNALFPEYTPGQVNVNVDEKKQPQQKQPKSPQLEMGEDDIDPPATQDLVAQFNDQALANAGISRQDLTNLLQAGDLVPKYNKSRDGTGTWTVKPAPGRDGVIKAWRAYNKAKASGQQVQPPPIPFKQAPAPAVTKQPSKGPKKSPVDNIGKPAQPAAPTATPAPAPTSPAQAPAAPAVAPAAPAPAPAAPTAPQSAPKQPATKPAPMQDLSPEEQQEKFNAARTFLKRYKLNDEQIKRLLDSGVFDMVKTAPAEGKSVAQWKAVTNGGKGKKLSDYINMVKQPTPKQGMSAVDDMLSRQASRGTAWYRKGR